MFGHFRTVYVTFVRIDQMSSGYATL